jgi:NTE family protein
MNRHEFLRGGVALGVASVVATGARGSAAAHGTRPLPGAVPARVALVLGGGGCRGHGHIGVIRVLEKFGLKPDLVVGSSAGSLVGALYAAGLSADQIERYGRSISTNLLRDWIFPKLGVFGNDAIRRFVVDRVGTRSIDSLSTRFAAVATDLRSGAMVVLDRGDLGLAVQASSSIPGLMEPVHIGDRDYVDGNLSAPLPVEAARRLGASHIVAVDVTFPPEQADLRDPIDVIYQAFSILTRKLAFEEGDRADLAITPRLPDHHDNSPAGHKVLVAAGEGATIEAMPKLRVLFPAPPQASNGN